MGHPEEERQKILIIDVKTNLRQAQALINGRPGDPIEEVRHLQGVLKGLHRLYYSDGLVKADKINIGVEMRRTERLIGQAIKRGQQAHMIATRGAVGGWTQAGHVGSVKAKSVAGRYRGDHLMKVKDVLGVKNTSDCSPFYEMAEPIPEEAFDGVIKAAVEAGNISRDSIVRRMRMISDRDPNFNVKQIKRLAASGHNVDQIAKFTGLRRGHIRLLARRHNIDMPGDVTTRNNRRLDDQLIVTRTVEALEGIAVALEVFDPKEVNDTEEAELWADSVATSIKALIKFHKQLKEMS